MDDTHSSTSFITRREVSWSAGTAITKDHEVDGLNNKHLFLTVLEVGKSKIKVPADLVPGESQISGLQMAKFLLWFLYGRERESIGLFIFL